MFNNGTLMVSAVAQRDTGTYTCTAQNGVDPPVSRDMQLVIAREWLRHRSGSCLIKMSSPSVIKSVVSCVFLSPLLASLRLNGFTENDRVYS